MPDTIQVPLTLALIWALEASKIGWHGRWRKNPLLTGIHAGIASTLAFGAAPWPWSPLAAFGAFCVVLASHFALWDTSEGNWWSQPIKPVSDRWHVLSALSSWPVEIAALWAVAPLTSPLNALWWALAGLGGYLIWTSPLRPAHWGKSMWRLW